MERSLFLQRQTYDPKMTTVRGTEPRGFRVSASILVPVPGSRTENIRICLNDLQACFGKDIFICFFLIFISSHFLLCQ